MTLQNIAMPHVGNDCPRSKYFQSTINYLILIILVNYLRIWISAQSDIYCLTKSFMPFYLPPNAFSHFCISSNSLAFSRNYIILRTHYFLTRISKNSPFFYCYVLVLFIKMFYRLLLITVLLIVKFIFTL